MTAIYTVDHIPDYTARECITSRAHSQIERAPVDLRHTLYLSAWCVSLARMLTDDPRMFGGMAATLERLCNGHVQPSGVFQVRR